MNSGSKKQTIQNEQFYVKKRGLIRKAEQVVRLCNSDVYIIVHQKDTDKIFSFTSDEEGFTLEKISALVLRDVQQGACLKKNKKYDGTDFHQVKKNIEEIQRINNAAHAKREKLPGQLMQERNNQFLLADRNGIEPTENETGTEDMSMSAQMFSHGKSANKYESTNEHLFSPKSNKKPAKQQRLSSDSDGDYQRRPQFAPQSKAGQFTKNEPKMLRQDSSGTKIKTQIPPTYNDQFVNIGMQQLYHQHPVFESPVVNYQPQVPQQFIADHHLQQPRTLYNNSKFVRQNEFMPAQNFNEDSRSKRHSGVSGVQNSEQYEHPAYNNDDIMACYDYEDFGIDGRRKSGASAAIQEIGTPKTGQRNNYQPLMRSGFGSQADNKHSGISASHFLAQGSGGMADNRKFSGVSENIGNNGYKPKPGQLSGTQPVSYLHPHHRQRSPTSFMDDANEQPLITSPRHGATNDPQRIVGTHGRFKETRKSQVSGTSQLSQMNGQNWNNPNQHQYTTRQNYNKDSYVMPEQYGQQIDPLTGKFKQQSINNQVVYNINMTMHPQAPNSARRPGSNVIGSQHSNKNREMLAPDDQDMEYTSSNVKKTSLYDQRPLTIIQEQDRETTTRPKFGKHPSNQIANNSLEWERNQQESFTQRELGADFKPKQISSQGSRQQSGARIGASLQHNSSQGSFKRGTSGSNGSGSYTYRQGYNNQSKYNVPTNNARESPSGFLANNGSESNISQYKSFQIQDQQNNSYNGKRTIW